ncbi:MAG: hypothetical protein IPM48_14310 [Saprospiraceae bacterium]|nr:hypothetical protein [Saprospiraceae bacterium]
MSDCIPNREVILNCFKEYFEFRRQIDWFIDPKLYQNVLDDLELKITEESILRFEFWSDFYIDLLDFHTSPLPSHSYFVIESAYFKFIILDTFSRFLLKNGTSVPFQLDTVICPVIPLGGLLCYFKKHKSEIFAKEYGMDLNEAEDSYQEIEFLNTIDSFEDVFYNFNRQVVPMYDMTPHILDSRFINFLNASKTQGEFFVAKRKILNTFSQNEFFNLFNPFDRLKREIEIFSENLNTLSFLPPELNLPNISSENRSFKIKNFDNNVGFLRQLFPYSKLDIDKIQLFLELFNHTTPIIPINWYGFIGDLYSIISELKRRKLIIELKYNGHWEKCIQCFKNQYGSDFKNSDFLKGNGTRNEKEIINIIKNMR